jgi:putative membrane protein
LVVYVTRYALYQPRLFAGEGAARVAYLAILATHTVLAVAVGPLALVTLRRALRGDFRRHRRLARVTLPVWLYVVISGWVIYLMLYWI